MCAPADQLEAELLKRLRIVEVPGILQYLLQFRPAAFEFAGRGVRRQHPRQHPGAAFTPRLLRRRQRIRECRQHLFADFSGERLDYRSRRGNYVPVRNLSRTNSRRPFSRKCVPPNRIKGSLFSLQSEQRIRESAAIHRDERADLPAAHSPRELPPRETIRKNPKQFGTFRYEKEPENRLSLPSKICGGG